MKSLIFFLLFLLAFSACTADFNYSGAYKINGKVAYDNGAKAANSEIYIDDVYKTNSNREGEFEIKAIDAGKHTLKIICSDSTSITTNEREIDLCNENLNLDALLLPIPIKLYEPDSVLSTYIKLSWSKSTASDFREYKIYMNHNSAIDESSNLIHVSTNRNDTVLEVKAGDFWWGGATVEPNTKYFFRVYTTNEYGRSSGSNILDVTTVLWEHPDDFTNNYTLTLESAFSAQGNLTGIAWDGKYFWMAYYEELGGFYDNNRITLTKFNHVLGTTLDTIVFDDSNYSSSGITWDGSNVWISFGNYISSVNITNETLEKSYFAGDNTEDLAWDKENLFLLDTWNKVISFNPIHGSIKQQFVTPFVNIGYSGEKGITSKAGEIWIINNWHREICITNNSGKHIGVADVDFLQEGFQANGHRMPMCFMDDKLVIALDSQVRIYSITKK